MTEGHRREPIISSIVPTFVVDDVGATVRWYVEELGFVLKGRFPEREPFAYASLMLGAAELMLLRLEGYRKPDLVPLRPEGVWDAYLRARGVGALYARLRGRPFIHSPLRRRPYGDWEFEVRDPNGYLLVFGGDAGAAEADP